MDKFGRRCCDHHEPLDDALSCPCGHRVRRWEVWDETRGVRAAIASVRGIVRTESWFARACSAPPAALAGRDDGGLTEQTRREHERGVEMETRKRERCRRLMGRVRAKYRAAMADAMRLGPREIRRMRAAV